MCPGLLLYNSFDNPQLEKHELLIPFWVKLKRSICVLPPLPNFDFISTKVHAS